MRLNADGNGERLDIDSVEQVYPAELTKNESAPSHRDAKCSAIECIIWILGRNSLPS